MDIVTLCGFIAYLRDEKRCVYCALWRDRPYQIGCEVDHVFGRVKSYYHHWALRLTLCRECHYERHHGKNGWFDHDAEIKALYQANLRIIEKGWDVDQVEIILSDGREDILRCLRQWRIEAFKKLAQEIERLKDGA